MWYSSYDHEQDRGHVLYAESTDGLTWIKPNLDGNGRNMLLDDQNANLPSLIHTPHDLSRPFKLMVYKNNAWYGYGSVDGIETVPYPENPILSSSSDVAHFYWDPNMQHYRATTKVRKDVLDIQRRVVRFNDSEDMIHWVAAGGAAGS